MVYFVVMKMFAQCCVWNAEHPASSHVTCSRPHIAACQLQVRRAVALHTGGQVHGNVLSPTQKSSILAKTSGLRACASHSHTGHAHHTCRLADCGVHAAGATHTGTCPVPNVLTRINTVCRRDNDIVVLRPGVVSLSGER